MASLPTSLDVQSFNFGTDLRRPDLPPVYTQSFLAAFSCASKKKVSARAPARQLPRPANQDRQALDTWAEFPVHVYSFQADDEPERQRELCQRSQVLPHRLAVRSTQPVPVGADLRVAGKVQRFGLLPQTRQWRA